jgi:CRP/FNR family cyclic AMP-dependent transcriptional regulator
MQRALFILGVLEDDDVDWLISVGQRQVLSPGSVLIHEGQPSDSIFLILDGLLEVSIAALEAQPIAQLAGGEVVGEMSFVDGQLPSATVSARQPSIVLAIDCTHLKQKLEQDVWFSARFFKALSILLSSRLRSTVKTLQGEHWRPVTREQGQDNDDMTAMLSVGKIRFDWMLKRLRDINSNPWEGLDPMPGALRED